MCDQGWMLGWPFADGNCCWKQNVCTVSYCLIAAASAIARPMTCTSLCLQIDLYRPHATIPYALSFCKIVWTWNESKRSRIKVAGVIKVSSDELAQVVWESAVRDEISDAGTRLGFSFNLVTLKEPDVIFINIRHAVIKTGVWNSSGVISSEVEQMSSLSVDTEPVVAKLGLTGRARSCTWTAASCDQELGHKRVLKMDVGMDGFWFMCFAVKVLPLETQLSSLCPS